MDGDVLPDAFVHSEGLLPHLHEGLEKIFPRARACEDAGDLVLQEKMGLKNAAQPLAGHRKRRRRLLALVEAVDRPMVLPVDKRVVSTTIHGLKRQWDCSGQCQDTAVRVFVFSAFAFSFLACFSHMSCAASSIDTSAVGEC